MTVRGFVRDLLSYIWGIKEEVRYSPQSGWLEVWYINQRFVLHTARTNYSFASLHRIFQNVLKQINFRKDQESNVLLLGGGAGSVPYILEKELSIPARITAVENDPEVINLRNKYFTPEQLQATTWIIEDAYAYISKQEANYDLIIADLFHDDEVPEQFIQHSFLRACRNALSANGNLIFNFMTTDKAKREKYEALKKYWQKQEGRLTELIPESTNTVLLWQKNSSAALQRSY